MSTEVRPKSYGTFEKSPLLIIRFKIDQFSGICEALRGVWLGGNAGIPFAVQFFRKCGFEGPLMLRVYFFCAARGKSVRFHTPQTMSLATTAPTATYYV